jgi:hypothetical protein
MFRSIVRPVRVSRFSKTVSLPQSNSSSIPPNRHGFNFDRPPDGRCLAQPPTSIRSRTKPVVVSRTEQTQRSPRTRDLIAHARGRANVNSRPNRKLVSGGISQRRHQARGRGQRPPATAANPGYIYNSRYCRASVSDASSGMSISCNDHLRAVAACR